MNRLHLSSALLLLSVAAPLSAVTIDASTMTRSVPPQCGTPAPAGTFLTTDAEARVWFRVADARPGDVVSGEWRDPDGNVDPSDRGVWTTVASYGTQCFDRALPVAGHRAASAPGIWTAQVFWNGYPVYAQRFLIEAPGTSAPAKQPRGRGVLPGSGAGWLMRDGTEPAARMREFAKTAPAGSAELFAAAAGESCSNGSGSGSGGGSGSGSGGGSGSGSGGSGSGGGSGTGSGTFSIKIYEGFQFSTKKVVDSDSAADIWFYPYRIGTLYLYTPYLAADRIQRYSSKPDVSKLTAAQVDGWHNYIDAPTRGEFYVLRSKDKKYYLLELTTWGGQGAGQSYWQLTFNWQGITVN